MCTQFFLEDLVRGVPLGSPNPEWPFSDYNTCMWLFASVCSQTYNNFPKPTVNTILGLENKDILVELLALISNFTRPGATIG